MLIEIPRLIISAPSSHSGKTTITCALISLLKSQGLRISGYKAGADYIDPDYLRTSGACSVNNLDLWLMNKTRTLELFALTSKNSDIAVIEGVMGLFDGGGYSTAGLAKLLKAPVILVVNVSSSAESVAAIVQGFKNYDRDVNVAGVILNCAGSKSHVNIIKKALNENNIHVYGAVLRDENLRLPERHLGLVPANETHKIIDIAPENFDIEGIIKLSKSAYPLEFTSQHENYKSNNNKRIKIAVAYDDAFSFYYPESLDTLKNFGAELIYFSPLRDKILPSGIQALILGGGFPEIFAAELSRNEAMKKIIKEFDAPIYAECGGYIYLCDELINFNGEKFSMAGLINAQAVMNKKNILGYIEACSIENNLLCVKDQKFRAHEFHFSTINPNFDENKSAFKITRRSTGDFKIGGYAYKNILASYLHINFFGWPELAERFISFCRS